VTRALDIALAHDGVLLDAFGVLVDSEGSIAGAPEFVRGLEASGVPYLVVTNDASRRPETVSDKLQRGGLSVSPDRILTSGLLLERYFEARDLRGARCIVLGPADSRSYVERAGGVIVTPDEARSDLDVVVIGDESGFPFLETVDAVLGPLVDAFERGRPPRLVVPNPDLVYPKPDRGLGLASGGVAAIFEAVLASKFPNHPGIRFDRLGKPAPELFVAGRERLGANRVVMFGDTPATDVAGAQSAGIAAALVLTGVTRSWPEDADPKPDWILPDLR